VSCLASPKRFSYRLSASLRLIAKPPMLP
jgi:hypothetical protein